MRIFHPKVHSGMVDAPEGSPTSDGQTTPSHALGEGPADAAQAEDSAGLGDARSLLLATIAKACRSQVSLHSRGFFCPSPSLFLVC